ncbi:MAG: hypothetical protein RSG07_04915 [Erysipelotrichaceae bacterium]
MSERKKFMNEEVEEDLYQFELGNELGVEVQEEKNNHLNSYCSKTKTTTTNTTNKTNKNKEC